MKTLIKYLLTAFTLSFLLISCCFLLIVLCVGLEKLIGTEASIMFWAALFPVAIAGLFYKIGRDMMKLSRGG
ncbi:MAG: hypothetical protein GY870_04655 [archaeon]|nr:hypothetical protein [archaeon]